MAALVGLPAFRVGRHQTARIVSVTFQVRRNESTKVVKGQNANLAAHSRGRGGRSSFSGVVATVLGSSGFVGRYVVNQLGKIGSQVICPYRGEPYYMKDLRLAGDLGQILFLPYTIRDDDSLRKVMKYSNVVINLVGREYETKNFDFQDVHVTGARNIARIAKEMGVEKLVHFSHLNASPNPQPIMTSSGSEFLKAKFYGEMAVREEFPEAIIFRPSDIYGQEDRFLNYYANRWRRAYGRMPLWKKGTQTIKMPVHVADVAKGVANVVQDPDALGKTFEIVGPKSYLLSELVDYYYRCMRHEHFKRTFISPIFKMKVFLNSQLPNNQKLSLDKLEWEHVSDVVTGLPTLEDMGIQPATVEERTPWELKPFRKYAYYEEKLGEWPDPEPPIALA